MTVSANPDAVAANSFIELGARSRARAILDSGSFHELLGPFDRLHSPWLEMQDIVPQEDDGVIVAQGCLDGERAVVIALEGSFQGGSIGEVGGAKAGFFAAFEDGNDQSLHVDLLQRGFV